MKNNRTTFYVVLIISMIFVIPLLINYFDDYGEVDTTVHEYDDFAHITDIDYKATVLDDSNNGGNLHVKERITYDVHAANKNNPFWELWRDLPESDVDGLPVRYEVLSVKQILDDGTEIVYEESPKLYWDDSDYTDIPYGPGKWYHSEGPYDDYYNFECVLFYVDGLYRDTVTFEIEYIMTNASLKYSDVSQLFLSLYSDSSIEYLDSYKAQILISDKDMPRKRNYYASTYGTKDYKYEFTESSTLNPGYHTFIIDLDKDELKFDGETEYLEFSFISFNEDVHIFTENAPDYYYYPYLDELKTEIEDYYSTPLRERNEKIKLLTYCSVASALFIFFVFCLKRNVKSNYTFFKPTTKIDYFREIPSDLDPHFASFLVFSKGKYKDRLSDTMSSLMLSLVRKEYIELQKIDPTKDWDFNNIKIKLLYMKPILKGNYGASTGPKRSINVIESSNENYVNRLINGNKTANATSREDMLSNGFKSNPVQNYTSTNEFNMPKAYYEKYNIRGKKLEKLTSNEEEYFNLILRYARMSFHEIKLSNFQDRVSIDNDIVDSVVTAIEKSIDSIGTSGNYFSNTKYNSVQNKLLDASTFLYIASCICLTIGNIYTYFNYLEFAFGAFFILGTTTILCGLYLANMSKEFMLLTQFGEDEREKWIALYNFLNSETLMNEKTVIDVKLWEKYLVYATAFGISEKVCKALKIRCPEAEVSNSTMLRNNYYRTSGFRSHSRSIGRYARSSSNTSRAGRYHGGYYGGGGFYGGGGRGGGGGGGGH